MGLKNHVAMIEMDTGSGQPLGFRVDARSEGTEAEVKANQKRILDALSPLIPLFETTGERDNFLAQLFLERQKCKTQT